MEGIGSVDSITKLQRQIHNGQIVALIMGVAFLGFTIYASHLSIKAHKLTIKKLNDEGYI